MAEKIFVTSLALLLIGVLVFTISQGNSDDGRAKPGTADLPLPRPSPKPVSGAGETAHSAIPPQAHPEAQHAQEHAALATARDLVQRALFAETEDAALAINSLKGALEEARFAPREVATEILNVLRIQSYGSARRLHSDRLSALLLLVNCKDWECAVEAVVLSVRKLDEPYQNAFAESAASFADIPLPEAKLVLEDFREDRVPREDLTVSGCELWLRAQLRTSNWITIRDWLHSEFPERQHDLLVNPFLDLRWEESAAASRYLSTELVKLVSPEKLLQLHSNRMRSPLLWNLIRTHPDLGTERKRSMLQADLAEVTTPRERESVLNHLSDFLSAQEFCDHQREALTHSTLRSLARIVQRTGQGEALLRKRCEWALEDGVVTETDVVWVLLLAEVD